MTAILTYAEIFAGIIGLCLILIIFIICIRLIIKTAGKLRNVAIYFLVCSVPGAAYILGRLFNIEVLLAEGKLINLILVAIISLLILMGLLELNKIVNELKTNKKEFKTEIKPKKEIKINANKPEQKTNQNFVRTIGDKYLDLTGKKPRYR